MPFDIEAARATLDGARHHEPAELRTHMERLAVPRLSGTEGAAEAEVSLRSAFEELGYDTTELPFSFSSWAGRFALPTSGVVIALTGAGGTALLYQDLPIPALVALLAGLGLALLPLLFLGPALRRLPLGRVESHNLLFTRPDARPAWLVMAHRDSKSQLVPTLIRTAAIAAAAVGWAALLVLAALWIVGDPFRFPGWALAAGALVVAAGLLLALAWSGNRSPGALDNATGLAALLAVAGSDPGPEVGFLVTDGEEMGLAGARAVVGSLPVVQGVINVDGLDDDGTVRVAEGHGWRRQGSAPQLAAALLTAAGALGVEMRRQPLPRSFMVDHVPIAAAGIPALTVLRGQWRSLLRVHGPGDSVDRLTGRGAAESATLLSAALHLLRAEHASHLAGGRGGGS